MNTEQYIKSVVSSKSYIKKNCEAKTVLTVLQNEIQITETSADVIEQDISVLQTSAYSFYFKFSKWRNYFYVAIIIITIFFILFSSMLKFYFLKKWIVI